MAEPANDIPVPTGGVGEDVRRIKMKGDGTHDGKCSERAPDPARLEPDAAGGRFAWRSIRLAGLFRRHFGAWSLTGSPTNLISNRTSSSARAALHGDREIR